MGKKSLDMDETQLLEYITHTTKWTHKVIFYFSLNIKLNDQVDIHTVDELRIKKYLGWPNKQ